MLKIEITAQTGGDVTARDQLDEALRALGYMRESPLVGQRLSVSDVSFSSADATDDSPGGVRSRETYAAGTTAEDVAAGRAEPLTPDTAIVSGADAPKRERGKPGPGRQRRTKEEMAEDAAAEAAELQGGAPQLRTNPENRVGPQDSPEAQAQDLADEKAESEATHGPDLTLDDVREAVGRYYTKYGMGPATADIQAIFGCKLHEIPERQDAFQKAIAAVDGATEANPYNRAVVGAEAPAKPVTIDDLKVVMGRYMKTFGEDEGYADLPRILGVAQISSLPNDPEVFKAKIALVEDALAANPFGRKVRA